MILMIPFTPHLSYECLEMLNCKNTDTWPQIKQNVFEEIKLAVQINGKTRDIILVEKGLAQEGINKIIFEKSKAKKFVENKKIIRTIFNFIYYLFVLVQTVDLKLSIKMNFVVLI